MVSAAVYNEEKEEVTIFAVNRNTEKDILFEADVRGFEGYCVKEYLALESDDMKIVNSAKREAIKPIRKSDYKFEEGIFHTVMKKYSWNAVRFGK